MLEFCPLFSVIPATILLIISFFVLLAVEKTSGRGLKVFGWVLAILLWVYAAFVVSMGAYMIMSSGSPVMKSCPMWGYMQESSK